MSFFDRSRDLVSEKIILCTIESAEIVKLFDLESGSIYSRDVNFFVSSVKVGATSLARATSNALSAGQFYYDISESKLYVRMSDNTDPKENDVAIFYKHFFSNGSFNLPHDLARGDNVHFDSRLERIGSINQQLDDEAVGVVLESRSSIDFENNDGFFDEIYDRHIWENKEVLIYQWFNDLPIEENRIIFKGVIESKDFSPTSVKFNLNDDIFKLRNLVNLELFDETDGILDDSTIGSPKRRIYGQVKQCRTIGIDKTLDGFTLTGTISGTIETTTITGAGTLFFDECSPSDEIIVTVNNEEFKLKIEEVVSNTSITLSSALRINLVGVTAKIKPQVPYRKKNREWHIAGHELFEKTCEVTNVISTICYEVDDISNLFVGDTLEINGQVVRIRRISGNILVLNQSLTVGVIVGDIFTRSPVSKVFFGNRELIIDRDWTLSNNPNDAILEIDDLAEFNITGQRNLGLTVTFTNGSRTISTSATVDFRSILKPRDWIRKNSVTETTWYEILDVKEQSIILRTTFTGSTQSTSALIKQMDIIQDDSLVTVDCYGKGSWIRTPADAVRDLIENDALLSPVNTDSFNKANSYCNYIVSMVVPERVGDKPPLIRDVITKLNKSIFGSLFIDDQFQIAYSIVNSRKPEGIETIKDDDILSFNSDSINQIISDIRVNYRPFTDIESGEDTFELYEKTSPFVNSKIGIKKIEEVTLYLYEDAKAAIMGQRYLFLKSLSNLKVTLNAKTIFSTTALTDKILVELDRIYKRFGVETRKKLAIVTGIQKDGYNTKVVFSDFGGIFNRVPSIAPSGTNDFQNSTNDENILWGYIVDNDTETPDDTSEVLLGCNLIG